MPKGSELFLSYLEHLLALISKCKDNNNPPVFLKESSSSIQCGCTVGSYGSYFLNPIFISSNSNGVLVATKWECERGLQSLQFHLYIPKKRSEQGKRKSLKVILYKKVFTKLGWIAGLDVIMLLYVRRVICFRQQQQPLQEEVEPLFWNRFCL